MKIIGLDIGSYSIKTVEMDVGLNETELISFFEEKLTLSPAHALAQDVQNGLKNLFFNAEFSHPFKLISALSGLLITSRFLTLPFKDKTKIRQTLPFELEEHIPFSLDQIIFDYKILSTENNISKLFIVIADKEDIKERLHLLENLSLNSDILSADGVSLFNLTTLPGFQDPKEIYAIVDIGKIQTSLCVIDEKKMVQARSIALGGQAITETLSKEYRLSLEEAEKAKIENGFILTHETQSFTLSHDQVKFSNCIKKSLEPLILQLNQTFQSNRSRGQGVVRKIYLTGGTSLLRNLSSHLAEELQMEVEHFNPLSLFENNNIAATPENNAKITTALSLALGGVGRNVYEQYNFRKNEFSKAAKGHLQKEVKYLLGATSLILFILLMNIIGNTFILRSMLKKIDRQMIEVTKKFPIKVPEHLLENAQALRAFLSKTQKEQDEKIAALGGKKKESLSTLQILKEVSMIVPKEILFDVRELSIADRKVKMKAIAESFNSIENIEKSLKNHPYFTHISKGEISTAADGQNKDFTMTFEVKGTK